MADDNESKDEPGPDRNLEPIRGDIRLTFPVMNEDGITDAGVTILASNGRVHFWDSFNTDNPKHWEALAGCSPALAKLVRRVLESDARLVGSADPGRRGQGGSAAMSVNRGTIRWLATGATPGPWTFDAEGHRYCGETAARTPWKKDAAYLSVLSPEVVTKLLDREEKARELLLRVLTVMPGDCPLERDVRAYLAETDTPL